MMSLTIDRALEEPAYGQVASQLRRLIASGVLSPGASLPSVRQLAGDLGVSLNTIARAYRLLETEGFLDIRDRSGVAVAAPATELRETACAGLLNQLRALLARLRQAGMATDDLLAVLRHEVAALADGKGGQQP